MAVVRLVIMNRQADLPETSLNPVSCVVDLLETGERPAREAGDDQSGRCELKSEPSRLAGRHRDSPTGLRPGFPVLIIPRTENGHKPVTTYNEVKPRRS